jgi:hypothetical protein
MTAPDLVEIASAVLKALGREAVSATAHERDAFSPAQSAT